MNTEKKRATPWKEGKIISIRIRNGSYVLAQMLKSPYILFFNLFNKDNDWGDIDLSEDKILFCKAVTRQFLKYSEVEIIKKVNPLVGYKLPSLWIYAHAGANERII